MATHPCFSRPSRRSSTTSYLHTSGCIGLSAGGIATLVRKSICIGVVQAWVPLVPGRVGYLDLCKGDGRLRLWNVHNFGLTRTEEEAVTRELAASCGSCSLLAGDFNFLTDGDKVLRLTADGGTRLDGGDGSGAARQSVR